MRQIFPGISSAVYSKLISEIYHFWITKRNRQHKPCNRKFWPTTSVTDSNPHMVFRPREKERYRLRKHRKNDLDSYRKLQQLRREFGNAQSLLQLVIEREKLKKADFVVQAEILDQTIHEIQNPSAVTARIPLEGDQFSYNLQYPLLLKPAESIIRRKDVSSGLKLSLKMSKYVC